MNQQLTSHTPGLTSVPDEPAPPDPAALRDQALTDRVPVPPASGGKPTSMSIVQCVASTGRGVAIALPPATFLGWIDLHPTFAYGYSVMWGVSEVLMPWITWVRTRYSVVRRAS
ncbi:hypothetical protein [Streptomyces sp. NPDC046887]|uniref:hypothetical protein n=1 Tax=Streptomyces sp. NPDC046887 TaxID=3155472 RepID=UPI00340E0EB6